MPIKIPPKVKLKSLPLATKLFLRLVFLSEQHKTSAELRALARELDSKFPEVMVATNELIREKMVQVMPKDANAFDFTVEGKVKEGFLLNASNFNRHLRARAERKARIGIQRITYPAHLTPFSKEQRDPWVNRSEQLVSMLDGHNHDPVRRKNLVHKVANCLARLGNQEISDIAMAAVLAFKATPNPAMSQVGLYFYLYRARREELVPAVIPAAACA